MALGTFCLCLALVFTFGICFAGASPCQGNIGNSEVYAPFGGWAQLNCTHNCTQAVWESRLTKRNVTKGPGWVSVEVEVGTGDEADGWKASTISCTVLSGEEGVDNLLTVIPYGTPGLVTVDMEDNLEEGKSYNVTCTVHGVAPIQNLVVTFFRGKETIHQKTFKDDSRDGNITEAVTYQITAQRRDNMKDFSCQATLALGTDIGNVTVKSSSVTARTFGLPGKPYFNTSHWIAIGTKDTLICAVSDAFPPDNVTLTMLFNNITLSLTQFKKADGTVVGLASIPPRYFPFVNTYRLHCKAELLGLSVEDTKDIHIYESARIKLILSDTKVLLGGTMRVSCVLTNVHPDQYNVVISLNGKQICENPKWECNVTVKESSSAANVTCKALHKLNGTITYSAQQSITVIGKNTRARILIVILCIVVIAALIAIIVLYRKRKMASLNIAPGNAPAGPSNGEQTQQSV